MTFEELLHEHGVPIAPRGHRHTRPGWVNFDCPWCGPNSGKYHCGYSTGAGIVNCWQCGPHRTADTVAALLGTTAHKALQLLQGLAVATPAPQAKPPGVLRLPPALGPLQRQHRAYLHSRRFNTNKLVKLWGLRGIGLAGNGLAWRIFIPIYRQGKMVSWTARATAPTTMRYISAPADAEAYPAKQWLYGLDYVRHSVVITEGPTDVWRIGPGAVATLGLSYTTTQLLLLSSIPNRVVCFDNSPEAQRRAGALAAALAVYEGTTTVVQLDAPDPGSASCKEVKIIRKAYLE